MTPVQIATEIRAALTEGLFRIYCGCWDHRTAEYGPEKCVYCRLTELAERLEAEAEGAAA